MASTSKRPSARGKRKSRSLAFPVKFRLRIAKLHLQEGYSHKLIGDKFGITTHSIQRWVRAYRLHGAAELKPQGPINRKRSVSEQSASRRLQLSGNIPSTVKIAYLFQKRHGLPGLPGLPDVRCVLFRDPDFGQFFPWSLRVKRIKVRVGRV